MHVNDYKKYCSYLEKYPIKFKLRVVTGENVEIVRESESYHNNNGKRILFTISNSEL